MTTAMTVTLAAALAGLAPWRLALAQQQDPAIDEAAIVAAARGFFAARDANDATGLGELLTADADQQQPSGDMQIGREEIVAGSLAPAPAGRRSMAIESMRWITDDVVIIDGRDESAERDAAASDFVRTSLVIRRDGSEWRIAAIRNMLPTVPAR